MRPRKLPRSGSRTQRGDSVIETIRIAGLEGVPADQPRVLNLGALTLLHGRNGAGKSATLRAIELAMTGGVKKVGKTNEVLGQLVHRGDLDGEAEISVILYGEPHTFRQQIKLTLSTAKLIPFIDGDPGISARETDALRAHMLGAQPLTFDLEVFLGLSEAKRKDWLVENIAAAVPKETLPHAILLAALEELLGKDAVRTALALVAQDGNRERAAITGLLAVHAPTPRSYAELAAEIQTALVKAGVPALYELKHREALDAAARRRDAEKGLKGVAAGSDFVSPEQLAELAAQEKVLAARLDELGRLIGAGLEARRQVEGREAEIAKIDTEIQKMRDGMSADQVPTQADHDNVIMLKSELTSIEENVAVLQALMRVRDAALAHVQPDVDADTLLLCSACGRPFEGASAVSLKTMISESVADTETRDALLVRRAVILMASKAIDGKVNRLARFTVDAERLLKERQRWVQLNPDVAPVATYQLEQKELSEKFVKLRATRDTMAKAQGAAQLRAELSANIAALKRQEAWAKAMDDGARTVMHRPLKDAILLLNQRMQELLATSGYAPVIEIRGEDLAIGALFEGAYVPFERLSAGQQVVVGAGLAAALLEVLGPPLRVLLIEAGEVDGLHLLKMMEAMTGWTDSFDNVLVATHTADWKVQDWTVINLDAQPLEVAQ